MDSKGRERKRHNGVKAPASGDIRLRIETTRVNQFFSLFYKIKTEEGGFVSIDWGDGSVETFTDKTEYALWHVYAKVGEYIVKLTGSKFVEVGGHPPTTFRDAMREILSLKMPTDSVSVSLCHAFRGCDNLTGNIPAWDDCITDASYTYKSCKGLTGDIPAWGVKIVDTKYTYFGCSGLTGCSEELLQDPMPSRITEYVRCISGCSDEIRKHFTEHWGGPTIHQ